MKKSIKCAALLLLLTTAGCASTTKLNEALSSQDEEIVETEVEEEEPEVTVEEESEEPEDIEEEEPEPVVEETNPVAAIEPDEEGKSDGFTITYVDGQLEYREDGNDRVFTYSPIRWPSNGLEVEIPEYKPGQDNYGYYAETSDYLIANIKDQTIVDWENYVQELLDFGFTNEIYRNDHFFSGKNDDGDLAELYFTASKGNQVGIRYYVASYIESE